jgi:hypothetical protein
MNSIPKLPVLEAEPTNDTSALTCYALEWREKYIDAEVQKDALLAALETMLDFEKLHTFDQINATKAARAAIAKAKVD